LIHFLLLGALIFGVYDWMTADAPPQAGQIVITQDQIDNLRIGFTRVWRRDPTPSEADGLIQDFVREEVLAREATTLGLDRDDVVIRRRLRQKMEFITNDLAAPPEPTEAELEAFLAEHPDLFRIESRLTVRQVYLDPRQRRNSMQQDAVQLLAELNQPGSTADFRMLGDATMLNSELVDVRAAEVARQFGDDFARQVEPLQKGRWQGPVTSSYGDHLVFVAARTPGRMPALAEVRELVAREWVDARRRENNEKIYQELLKRYNVTIERGPSGTNENELAAQIK